MSDLPSGTLKDLYFESERLIMTISKRAAFITLAACAVLACAGCGGSGSSRPAAAPQVKLVDELDGSIGDITIMLGNQTLPNLGAGSQSQYLVAAAGVQSVTGNVYNGGFVDFPSTSVNLAAGSSYTLIAMGNPGVDAGGTAPIQMVLANDAHAAPSPGDAMVRYVGCAWNGPSYNVWVNGTSVLNDAYYGQVSNYSELKAGQISIESVLGNSPPYSVYGFAQTLTLTAGDSYTLYYLGGGGFDQFNMLQDS